MEYWTVSEGKAIKTQTCRECRGTIHKDEDVKVRDGRKIRLFYHPTCFSGSADPRTQARSSFHDPRYASAHLSTAAPPVKGHGKWSVEQYGYSPAVGFGTPAKVNAQEEAIEVQQVKTEHKERAKIFDAELRQRLKERASSPRMPSILCRIDSIVGVICIIMCSHNGLWQGVCLPRMYRAWICVTIVSDPEHRQNLFRDSSGIAENPYTPAKGVDKDLNLFYRAGYLDEIKQKQFAKVYLANRRQSSENGRRLAVERRAAQEKLKASQISLTDDDLTAVRKNSPTEGVRNIVPKERGSMRHARMRSRL
ncbi:hypothetical protein PhCBS80983_g01503 [Powellomyces hirtus]|uniref:PARP-type domain-containing protein n=1 Tax=Powellomyces hirtus TaxID=109895 RepID=A0A507EC56_9FUNG|nr:hypothetical protein PhCBS80983_g01503 [Powellomyces hirtus]